MGSAERSEGVEREVKLGAWAGMALPDLADVVAGAGVTSLPPQRLTATYFDTPDLRLARWGITVRHRAVETAGASDPGAELPWTVKLPGPDAPTGGLARREIGFAGGDRRVPPPVASLVRALTRTEPLAAVARLRTERLRLELHDQTGAPLAEIDDDEVSVLVGRRLASRFREVEVELASGADPSVLSAVVKCLRQAGAGRPDPTPKAIRALGPRALEPPDVVVPSLSRRATVAEVVTAAVAASVARLLRHDPGVRLGDDPEDVHQARVATRRLRSDLRTFRSLVDEQWAGALRDELGWIAGLLGEVRDADVLHERLGKQVAPLPAADAKAASLLLRRLADQREVAGEALRVAMDSPRYARLLDELVEAARAPVFAPAAVSQPAPGGDDLRHLGPLALRTSQETQVAKLDGSPASATDAGSAPAPTGGANAGDATAAPARAPATATAPTDEDGPEPRLAVDVLPALVRRPWRHLERAVAELGPEPTDDALHQVRIRAKRCRYAAEAAAGVMGKPADRLGEAVADLQTVLGDFHDAVVAEEWLREAAARGPASVALVAGELVAAEREEAEAGRQAWKGAWKRASSKKLRS
ncbi:MAG TPA: CYTH and CHAD domain-containing protein, partial [Acidimicrobiales bacterium]